MKPLNMYAENGGKIEAMPVPALGYPNASRLLYFRRVLDQVAHLQGDIVECGVGKGSSIAMFSYLVKEDREQRHIWGFDSFEGFPEPSEHDKSIRNPQKGEWNETSLPGVLAMLEEAGLDEYWINTQVTLVQGFLEDSLHKYRVRDIAVLHLDVDLYDSYKVALDTLYPRVIEGGVVMFDEYMATREHLKFPGAQKAIDEYMGDRINEIKRDEFTGKFYLIK